MRPYVFPTPLDIFLLIMASMLTAGAGAAWYLTEHINKFTLLLIIHGSIALATVLFFRITAHDNLLILRAEFAEVLKDTHEKDIRRLRHEHRVELTSLRGEKSQLQDTNDRAIAQSDFLDGMVQDLLRTQYEDRERIEELERGRRRDRFRMPLSAPAGRVQFSNPRERHREMRSQTTVGDPAGADETVEQEEA
ncbi:hypothetical protein BDV95DRAFT_589927 [Massariosphaeria phaeospora]|uniref:Uncharacterized protein n=1 Tax=Massariosphaeria phaeospora TaxID=100035 RepID=A0A7C8IIM3_9PLEO|nr:hypothetical protein BDV95DRAFT_589927 [Massariosphaeria phaeospora]